MDKRQTGKQMESLTDYSSQAVSTAATGKISITLTEPMLSGERQAADGMYRRT